MLFLKELRNKGALHYQIWMPLLIQYNGEKEQFIKLNITPNIPKSTYYRIIKFGIDLFPKYIDDYFLEKKRNILIIKTVNENNIIAHEIIKKEKKPKQIKVEEKSNDELIFDIIELLNQNTGKSYKPNSKVAILNINARIKEGYTKEDFFKVISVKSTKWMGTKFEDYLTPNTLFGTKFESYLNENLIVVKTKQENAYEQVIKATELGFNN